MMMQPNLSLSSLTISSLLLQKVWLSARLLKTTMSLKKAVTKMKQKHAVWKQKHKLKQHVADAAVVAIQLADQVQAALLNAVSQATVALRVVVRRVELVNSKLRSGQLVISN